MSDCCDPIVPPRNCTPRCNPQVSTDCVLDPSGYSCLDLPAGSTQSEINAAVIAALCSLSPGTLCPTFVDIDMASEWVTTLGAQDPAASDPIGCIVRLRGAAERVFSKFEGDKGCHKYQLVLTNTNLPSNQRPSFIKLLSLVVQVNETNNPGSNESHFFPATLLITTLGQIVVSFYIDHCLNTNNAPFKITMSLDGLTFETN